jgi:hypothetical protein
MSKYKSSTTDLDNIFILATANSSQTTETTASTLTKYVTGTTTDLYNRYYRKTGTTVINQASATNYNYLVNGTNTDFNKIFEYGAYTPTIDATPTATPGVTDVTFSFTGNFYTAVVNINNANYTTIGSVVTTSTTRTISTGTTDLAANTSYNYTITSKNYFGTAGTVYSSSVKTKLPSISTATIAAGDPPLTVIVGGFTGATDCTKVNVKIQSKSGTTYTDVANTDITSFSSGSATYSFTGLSLLTTYKITCTPYYNSYAGTAVVSSDLATVGSPSITSASVATSTSLLSIVGSFAGASQCTIVNIKRQTKSGSTYTDAANVDVTPDANGAGSYTFGSVPGKGTHRVICTPYYGTYAGTAKTSSDISTTPTITSATIALGSKKSSSITGGFTGAVYCDKVNVRIEIWAWTGFTYVANADITPDANGAGSNAFTGLSLLTNYIITCTPYYNSENFQPKRSAILSTLAAPDLRSASMVRDPALTTYNELTATFSGATNCDYVRFLLWYYYDSYYYGGYYNDYRSYYFPTTVVPNAYGNGTYTYTGLSPNTKYYVTCIPYGDGEYVTAKQKNSNELTPYPAPSLANKTKTITYNNQTPWNSITFNIANVTDSNKIVGNLTKTGTTTPVTSVNFSLTNGSGSYNFTGLTEDTNYTFAFVSQWNDVISSGTSESFSTTITPRIFNEPGRANANYYQLGTTTTHLCIWRGNGIRILVLILSTITDYETGASTIIKETELDVTTSDNYYIAVPIPADYRYTIYTQNGTNSNVAREITYTPYIEIDGTKYFGDPVTSIRL